MVSVSQKLYHEKLGLIRFVASCSLVCLLSSSLLIDQEVCLVAEASPVERVFNWEVKYMFWKPDCVENIVMGINGEYPAPTIRANAGDTIVVNLTNHLHTEAVVIHWHGIRQLGTPWADGTASISQCPINPGETFLYNFTADKAGTFFYHGHYGMQRSAGLYGALIVDVEEGKREPFDYDEDFTLLLSDWWHQTTHKQEICLSSYPFRWIGEPQSLLINGRGRHDCSHLAQPLGKRRQCKIKEDAQCAPDILRVLPNKTYRLRIASTTSLASLNLQIGKHMMLLVEADGNYVRPKLLDDIDVYSGESYSVLIKTNQDPSINYWISISVRGRKPETPQGLAILSYNHSNNPIVFPPSAPPVSPKWDDYEHSKHLTYNIFATADSPKPPTTHDRRIILLNTQNRINGVIKWAINNISLVLPSTPYLGSIKHKLNGAFDTRIPAENFPRDYDISKPPVYPNTTSSSSVFTIQHNQTIDVILQNANALKEGVSEIHPWHLHGHDFWVLGYGEGRFIEETDDQKLNLEHPPLRNTAVVFPYGWTAIRFVADNPGVWAFHCHIEPHLHMGMGVIFAESVERIQNIPKEALACGLTAKVLMKNSTALIMNNSTRRNRPSGKG